MGGQETETPPLTIFLNITVEYAGTGNTKISPSTIFFLCADNLRISLLFKGIVSRDGVSTLVYSLGLNNLPRQGFTARKACDKKL
jgi:hypothetical protein